MEEEKLHDLEAVEDEEEEDEKEKQDQWEMEEQFLRLSLTVLRFVYLLVGR